MIESIIITNNTAVAHKACDAGVEYVMIDLEKNGKTDRQKEFNSWISDHNFCDIEKLKNSMNSGKVLVRINPYNVSTPRDIEDVISAGADEIMLPMAKNESECKLFVEAVDGRASTCILLETPQLAAKIEDVCKIRYLGNIHFGLNDLHISMKLKFMFELFPNGLIDDLSEVCRERKMRFGIGGIGPAGGSPIDGRLVIAQHARLGSTRFIISRGLKELLNTGDNSFQKSLNALKKYHAKASNFTEEEANHSKHVFYECIESYTKD